MLTIRGSFGEGGDVIRATIPPQVDGPVRLLTDTYRGHLAAVIGTRAMADLPDSVSER